MCSSDVHHSLDWDVIPKIWFFLWWWLALWWKNFVFLSPACNHMDRDLCRQKISSWLSTVLISCFSVLISCKIFGLFCMEKSFNADCLACNCVLKFPKIFRLHCTSSNLHFFIFSKRRNMGLPTTFSVAHAPLITPSQSGWYAHFSSNLVGIFFFLPIWFG